MNRVAVSMNVNSIPSPGIVASQLECVRAIAPRITELGHEAETLGRLPDTLVDLLKSNGCFSILQPRTCGGLELDVVEALEVIEEVSAADGSAGWCLLKVASSNQLAGYFDPEIAQRIWMRPDVVVAGSLNPKGRAVRDNDGWRVSGRWDWGTASDFADWLLCGATLFEPGEKQPIQGPQGPATRVFLIPRTSAQIVDGSWRVHGMRGTGSKEYVVEDATASDAFSFELVKLTPRQAGPLYARVPYLAQAMVPHAPVAIGIARSCVAALVELARGKTPLMSRSLLKDKGWVQDAVGRATADIAASRAFLHGAVRAAFAAETFTLEHALRLSLAATHATHRCVKAVDLMYRAAGGTAVYESSPIQRHFRDIHVAASHILVNVEKYAGAGRVIFGDSASPLN
jgi:alkylation response protein AidB-like acyl-CoA dehydrogenase